MKENFFNIILMGNTQINRNLINTDSLFESLDEFINSDNYMLCIFKTPAKEIQREIDKYYKSQYASLYSKYRRNKINEKQHKEALAELKRLKSASTTVIQFKQKFEEYKKNTNNIPPYNVSD